MDATPPAATNNHSTSPPSRRRWLRLPLYALAGLIALDLVLWLNRRQWESYSPDDYALRLTTCQERRPDLLIVGGSPVSESLDPRFFHGLAWKGKAIERPFNLGLPGATTSEVWMAVKNGAVAPPRLLIYGITASDLNDSRLEPHGPASLMTGGDVLDWARQRSDSRTWVVRQYTKARLRDCWQLFRYRHGLRLWAADMAERWFPGSFPEAAEEAQRNLRYSETLTNGDGFAPSETTRQIRLDLWKEAGLTMRPFSFLDNYRIADGHIRCLYEMLDWARENGVDVILLDMPVPSELDERAHPQAFAVYRAKLAELCRTRGVACINGHRDVVGLNDFHFADQIHCNEFGADQLSRWLREELDKMPAWAP